MNKTILVVDDVTETANDIAAKLNRLPTVKKRGYKAEACDHESFKQAINVLEDRAKAGAKQFKFEETALDRAGILIVDYDIAQLKDFGKLLTGERVAYLARCFSRCGMIVALNQYELDTFDLRLAGHPQSFADVNTGTKQVTSTGLWGGKWDGYRPWAWPALLDAAEAYERRIAALDLSASIFKTLAVPDDIIGALPSQVLSWIAPTKSLKDMAKVTFQEFLDTSRNARRGEDKLTPDYEKRVAAARIAKWLEHVVLPGQHILVDAPHLVPRFTSLMKGKFTIKKDLDGLCQLDAGAKLPIHVDRIAKHAFKAKDWLSRPAWWWEKIRCDEGILEVKEPWERKEVPLRFCEDTSDFRKDAEEFVADLASPFSRRFVARTEGVQYIPAVQFSL